MNPDERLGTMVEVLQRDGRLDVADMAAAFGTAEMTIRRDLDRIVALGMARRVRGGAISLLMRGEELPFALRVLDRAQAKRRIAAAVAELLRDGEAVVLDSGTTAVLVGRELAGRRLTVMPMTLHAASVLSPQDSIRLLLPGGDLRPGELAMVGPLALASIGALRFDTAVLTCCGLDDDRITTHDLGDAEVKRAMIRSSARVILAADSAKFRLTALAVVAPATDVDVIVTDAAAPPDAVESLRAAGVEVLCV
ncbi:MAG TPA: DeoR/GlpR family DNA-binding transcription regulator [Streptosporangiaceae bacterium]|nr:DeoR/GlpR family DNA-binding transcription regulator [Streptosporangiaceae bacterium]